LDRTTSADYTARGRANLKNTRWVGWSSAARTVFKHADENDWIARRPKYGTIFRKPLTGKRSGVGFSLREARALIAVATYNVQLEAMLLLMLNGGYTAKDCACLPRSAVDFDRNLIVFPRPKMARRNGIERAMVMWPETAEALKEVMAQRPGDELVFRTRWGRPWVYGTNDSVRLLTQRLVKTMWGKPARGPAWLRHLHRTIADELEKPHAAARLMGHRLKGMAQTYVDHIEHDRLEVVTRHIRERLWDLKGSGAGSA
jgi:integrase